MRVRLDRIALQGGGRDIEFRSGFNIVKGETTSGKTTLIKLIRALFGSSLEHMIREVRQHVSHIHGEILLGSQTFTVIRPSVSTRTAKVDIAGEQVVHRLPAIEADKSGDLTYGQWLIDQLELPHFEIATSVRPDSPMSAVTINDYFLYCYLKWNEIDTSVMDHRQYFKNQKRKVIFQVLYDIFTSGTFELTAKLREIKARLRDLSNQSDVIQRSFAGTPLGNRALITRNLEHLKYQLREVEKEAFGDPEAAILKEKPTTERLHKQIREIDREVVRLSTAIESEKEASSGLRELIRQLKAQNQRLSKAIVANDHLLDFDFIRCPRCGSHLDQERTSEDQCYLCLQRHSPVLTREDLQKEQNRLDAQIQETQELIEAHDSTTVQLQKRHEQFVNNRHRLAEDLDFATRSYMSDRIESLKSLAAKRATISVNIDRYSDYLAILDRLQDVERSIANLTEKERNLHRQLTALEQRESESGSRLRFLNDIFREILREFQVPHIGDPSQTYIDPVTYLPVYDGCLFDNLSSPGLIVQINVAHTLAHHLTAIKFGNPLPGFLMIDGFTSNLADIGLAKERKDRMYKYLIQTGLEHQDDLQIIVADDDVPDWAEEYVRIALTEDDRLIQPHVESTTNFEE
ncbi:hypothetical protein ACFL5K_04125 [Gemmatimonadota bacterium]